MSDASSSDAGMFLLRAFAWADNPTWSAHEIVAGARGRARRPSGTSARALTGSNHEAVEQYVADGVDWLVARGLLGPKAESNYGPYFMLTSDGLEAAKHGSATHIDSTLRLHSELLTARNATARPNLERGDYATAVFAATHQVEVAVRDAAGFGPEKYGVQMMRNAFKVGGPRADAGELVPEQGAVRNLFTGATGTLKNLASHRALLFDSPIQAASIIHLADLLLRIVDRAKERLAAEVSEV